MSQWSEDEWFAAREALSGDPEEFNELVLQASALGIPTEEYEGLDDLVAAGADKWTAERRAYAVQQGWAMPNGEFPIETDADWYSARQSIGRAKNRAAAVRHLRKRAKVLDIPRDEYEGITASVLVLIASTPGSGKFQETEVERDSMGRFMEEGDGGRTRPRASISKARYQSDVADYRKNQAKYQADSRTAKKEAAANHRTPPKGKTAEDKLLEESIAGVPRWNASSVEDALLQIEIDKVRERFYARRQGKLVVKQKKRTAKLKLRGKARKRWIENIKKKYAGSPRLEVDEEGNPTYFLDENGILYDL